MKASIQVALATTGLLAIASSATAQTAPPDFVRVEARNFTSFFKHDHPNAAVRDAYAGAGLKTYRVYAVFSGPARVLAHGGKAIAGATAWSESSDGAFWNHILHDPDYGDTHYNLAPTGPDINFNPSHAFDTFGTIGSFVNPTHVGFYPDASAFANQTNNMQTNWTAPDQGWFASDPHHQNTYASQTQQGLAEDGLYRVLLMQISVAQDVWLLQGNLGILSGISSQGHPYEIWDGYHGPLQYYVPAPGALALLGMAGLVGARRRRA
jgi:hypothetical protein